MRARRGRPATKPLAPFGIRMRALIERSGKFKNLEEFKRLVGVNRSTLYRIETGNRGPSVGTAMRIARVLGVTLDVLCGLEPPPIVAEHACAHRWEFCPRCGCKLPAAPGGSA